MAELGKQRVSIDRLSNFPDSILCHILSFLHTKYAVRTSTLSTRWRNLSTLVSNLDFGCHHPSDDFMNFVERVLLFHNMTCVERFRLVCGEFNRDEDEEIYSYRIRGWITYALKQPLQELYLKMSLEGSRGHSIRILPDSLFTSKTLVKLELKVRGLVMTIPTKVCFPSLKTLSLKHVEFVHQESIERLLSGCLVLEDLVAWNSWFDVGTLFISNSSLKTLSIGGDSETISPFGVEIDAPSLVYLRFDCIMPLDCSFLNLHSLVKADLRYLFRENKNVHPELIRSNLLGGISNVESLRFTNDFLKVLSFCQNSPPVYHNLVHVEISPGFDFEYACKGLAKLLECTPKLRTLIFKRGLGSLIWCPPKRVPFLSLI